jgi:hypothetical protein
VHRLAPPLVVDPDPVLVLMQVDRRVTARLTPVAAVLLRTWRWRCPAQCAVSLGPWRPPAMRQSEARLLPPSRSRRSNLPPSPCPRTPRGERRCRGRPPPARRPACGRRRLIRKRGQGCCQRATEPSAIARCGSKQRLRVPLNSSHHRTKPNHSIVSSTGGKEAISVWRGSRSLPTRVGSAARIGHLREVSSPTPPSLEELAKMRHRLLDRLP